MRRRLLPALILCISICLAHAQDSSSTIDRITNFPNRLFGKINKKANRLDEDLTQQTERYLQKLARQEARLQKQLQQQDSSKAAALFANNPQQHYLDLIQKLKSQGPADIHSMGPEYLPYADSLQGTLSFLNKNGQYLNTSKVLPAEVANSLASLQQLQSRLQSTEEIKQYIQQRKEQIRQYLSGYQQLPAGAGAILNNYNKQVFYCQSQIRQYREMLNDPDKMLREALVLLNKLPAFADFMKQNSFLAGLFTVSPNYGSADALVGLQSRDQVLAMIQSQIGQGGPNAASTIQSSLQTAQQDITNVQNKLTKLGAGSGDMDMPNFRPNTQKTRSFWQRLEYSTNLQTQHAAYYWPSRTDFGLAVGYKLSDNASIGIGGSYSVGWGTPMQHIHISRQGGSLRSYLDVRARKSFFVSGGYERNFLPPALPGGSWISQPSGLIGISKIVSMRSKVFKKTKLQFFWDFLSYQQVPKTAPFKFRVGYNF
ncbi:MAG TPA: hypothetical protein VHE34_09850 [Puia sp.]|uniref:hypothetical protein n=1 Tax=Puia sp. TaxID=2045100 RepID=UPI002CFEA620|nr:hypothetical protein [Puia sp.]HVU95518.1 hypothetical protein [Puia sp.]